MTSLAQLLANAAAVRADKERQDVLHGTGITKRVAESADKQFEKIQAKEAPKTTIDNGAPPVIDIADHDLPSTIMQDGLQLDQYQAAAVAGIKRNKYSVLIGNAGTGKTTCSKAIIHALENTVETIDLNQAKVANQQSQEADYNVAVCICAFTGRAVQQVKRALPKRYHPLCNTIHATLGYAPTEEEFLHKESGEYRMRKIFRPTFTASNRLPFKICFVDEASMVPISLWNELISALPDDCRIILVGDINQLPPVTGRSILGFAMCKWPTFALEHIHRQAADNPIIANAHRILNGRMPIADNKRFIIKTIPDGSMSAQTQIIGAVQYLHKNKQFDELQDALIVPQNISNLGQEALNEKLVRYFNPPMMLDNVPLNPRTIITAGYIQLLFARGDKVMLLQNDRQRGLTNGMLGVVKDIHINDKFKGQAVANSVIDSLSHDFDMADLESEMTSIAAEAKIETTDDSESERQASHVMTVKFQNVDDPIVFQTAGDYKKLRHAYAATCHKSQGGEYPTVVIVVHASNLKMLTREWLYTAVTRASGKVIMLVNHRGLTQAINCQTIKGSSVREKAESFISLLDKKDTTQPILPEPCEV